MATTLSQLADILSETARVVSTAAEANDTKTLLMAVETMKGVSTDIRDFFLVAGTVSIEKDPVPPPVPAPEAASGTAPEA